MNQYLNCQQKHNLHLLLRASFKNRDPMQVIAETGIDPALLTDILLRNNPNRQVSYEDLEVFSKLCYRLIRWKKDTLPEIEPNYTYTDQIECLLIDLSQDC